jgi:GDP-4-dehydro-6-deoxy-D-mannose reductase
MKVLVTGASGFTGRYLLEYLSLQKNISVIGFVHINPKKRSDNVEWCKCNLHNRAQTDTAIRKIIPDRIIHLAGLNHGSIGDLIRTNVLGTDNLLRAIKNRADDSRVLVIGSSAEYGYAGNRPISEGTTLIPVGDYGVSKVAEELLARSYFHRFGLQIAVARPFNLTGPGQTASFVCGHIISELVKVEHGVQDAVHLHETESCRDFIDVRDAVRAYWSILDHDRFSEACAGNAFNVGSGKSYSVSDILETIEAITGKKIPVELPEKPLKSIVPTQKSDNSYISQTTGWVPAISFRQSVADMVVFALK